MILEYARYSNFNIFCWQKAQEYKYIDFIFQNYSGLYCSNVSLKCEHIFLISIDNDTLFSFALYSLLT